MIKRLFDVVVSAVVVVAALPLWTIAAILIKLESRGPVFHRSERIGRGMRPFTLLKFRTMVADAALLGPPITWTGDPRVTRTGRLLRRFKIDEMPQLLNVLRGEMSIVGPRPEDPRYVAGYTTEELDILRARPGMASPAFIKYRHEEELLAQAPDPAAVYASTILPDKLALDLDYVRTQSLRVDLRVLGRAARSLFEAGPTADAARPPPDAAPARSAKIPGPR